MARFRQPLDLWTSGELWCNTGTVMLEIKVRVARVNDGEAGLAFQFRSDAEREAVRAVVAFAASRTGVVGNRPPF